MIGYILVLCIFTALKPVDIDAQNVNAGILQPPQNQYVLAGTKAIINCEAYGEIAYWIINGTALTSIHFLQLTQYEAMGITFANTSWTSQDQMNYNLTMTVPTYLKCAVRNIICVARDRGHRTVESGAVNIFVLQTLRPNAPILTIDSAYRPSVIPQFTATMSSQPLWQGYEITEFRVFIINGSDDSLLYQLTIPNNSSRNNYTTTIITNETLLESTAEQCYSIKVNASAVSSLYGLSEPTVVETAVFRVPGALSDQAINLTTLFNSDGSFSHVNVRVQLPDVCSYQPVNYTIIVDEVSGSSEGGEVFQSGPHSHQGAGLVSQDISGLQMDHAYTIKVLVDSTTGSVESDKQLFNTAADFDLTCSSPTIALTQRATDITSVYVIAMGIAIGTAVLVLVAFSISLVGLCVKMRRMKTHGATDQSRNGPGNSTSSSMVTNPIYAGPVYDIIDTRFEFLTKSSSPTLSIPLSPISPVSPLSDDSTGHDEYSHLTNSNKDKPKPRNVYTLPGGLRSPAAENLALKRNGMERNKQQLTLPVPREEKNNDRCKRREMNDEETYIDMHFNGAAVTRDSQPN